MNDAELHQRTHALLRSAKLAGWRTSRTASGFWRMTSPSGGAVGISSRPTVRQLLAAEAQFGLLQRANPSPTAGRGLAQPRTE